MAGRAQQGEVLALAVDVDQPLAEPRQDGGGDGAPVDPRGAAAPGGDLAREDQRLVPLARFVVQAELGQQGAHLGGAPRVAGRVEREDALDARARRAGADELGAGALAEDRAERVDDDRLARAGLAGERVEARPEVEPQPVDDREVADGQFQQHPNQS